MRSLLRWLISFSFLPFVSIPIGLSQAGQNPPKGETVEKVPCRLDKTQTYSLYLPSNYVPDKHWPILYALDAGARGVVPVERFKEAAETYGYILVGSNNSRNGPVKIVQDAVNALLVDTQTRFSVDLQRVYVAGFSGGARAAVQVGLAMKGKIAGIMAFGAGFPPDMPPTAATPFAMYIAGGDEDFNFPELRALDGTLKELQIPHFFETFRGGHEWPPALVCTHALEWFELQGMKSGIRAKDPLLLKKIHSKTILEAESLQKSGQVYASLARYSALVDFAGLLDDSSLEPETKRLSASAEVRKSRAREKEVETRQKAIDLELIGIYEDLIAGRDRQFSAQKLNGALDRLASEARQRNHETRRLAAARSLSRFWIMLNEETAVALDRQEYNAAILRMELMSRIRPDNPRIKFNLACVYSVGGREKEAMESLEKAVAAGFKDVVTIETIRDLEPLRNLPEYRKIIEDLKLQ
jgi:tetratricopeptide (TPR) repeat protein